MGSASSSANTTTNISQLLETNINTSISNSFETNINKNVQADCSAFIKQSMKAKGINVGGIGNSVDVNNTADATIDCKMTIASTTDIQNSIAQSVMQALNDTLKSSAITELDQSAKGGLTSASTKANTNTNMDTKSFTNISNVIDTTVKNNIDEKYLLEAKATISQQQQLDDNIYVGGFFNKVSVSNKAQALVKLIADLNLGSKVVGELENKLDLSKVISMDSVSDTAIKQKAVGGSLLDMLGPFASCGSSGSTSIIICIIIVSIISSVIGSMGG